MSDTLPNCLTNIPKEDRSIGLAGTWYHVFCASCGIGGPRVMATFMPAEYAFYLCNDCADKYGEVACTIKTPDDVFMEKVASAMMESYGHYLTEQEVLEKLGDKNSVISKLEREGQQRR